MGSLVWLQSGRGLQCPDSARGLDVHTSARVAGQGRQLVAGLRLELFTLVPTHCFFKALVLFRHSSLVLRASVPGGWGGMLQVFL